MNRKAIVLFACAGLCFLSAALGGLAVGLIHGIASHNHSACQEDVEAAIKPLLDAGAINVDKAVVALNIQETGEAENIARAEFEAKVRSRVAMAISWPIYESWGSGAVGSTRPIGFLSIMHALVGVILIAVAWWMRGRTA
jgi:hypothetical protein